MSKRERTIAMNEKNSVAIVVGMQIQTLVGTNRNVLFFIYEKSGQTKIIREKNSLYNFNYFM